VVGVADALTMASESPARALGIEGELGRLVPGAWADLVSLDPRTLELREVLIGGEPRV
jgi:N-acetylglucosamine-6-phosphate deacetylase